jgi:hypothetical protein
VDPSETRCYLPWFYVLTIALFRISDPKQAYYAQEAREFLRKRLIGKHVKVTVDFIRPKEGDYDERECATVRYGGQNSCISSHIIGDIDNLTHFSRSGILLNNSLKEA